MSEVPAPALKDTLRAAARQLIERGLDPSEARAEANWLYGHLLGRDNTWLFSHADDPLDHALQSRAESLLARRATGVPMAYVLGERDFWDFTLQVLSLIHI